MQRLILIGLAGLIGTLARFGVSEIASKRIGESFPWGTLIVNIVGCFLAGFLFYVVQERALVSETTRLAIMVGFLGGFTTFSSFGLQTFTLLKSGQVGLGLLNVAVSNVVGIIVVWVGYSVSKVALS
ncbi:MAG TPA: fluoride efflux transporter CrcB [Pyrinomonadaceae bacterium]